MTSEFNPIKIFLAYDDEDKLLKDMLTNHLLVLSKKELITFWSSSNIVAGEERKQVRSKNLSEADIILLLISSNFLASDECCEEMEEALKRHEIEDTSVIPILLRPVHWQDGIFSHLQALPMNGKPVALWPIVDEAFVNIVQSIKKVVDDLIKKQYLKSGEKLYENNQFDSALIAFEQAIRLDPQLEDAYVWRGRVLDRLEQYKKALAAYDQAIRLNPNNANYYAQKGAIFFKCNQHTEALATYDQAIRLNPIKAEYYIQKSNIYSHDNQHQEALAALSQAIRLDPKNPEYYFQITTHFIALKQYEEALSYIRVAIKLDSTKANYFARIAELFEQFDQTRQALETINQAIKLDPLNIGYLEKKTTYLWYLDQYQEALTTLDEVIKLDPHNGYHYIYKADRLLYLGQREEGLRISNSELGIMHIRYLLESEGYIADIIEKALEAIDQAIKLDPLNTEYCFKKGQVLSSFKRYDEALEVYNQLLKLDLSTSLKRQAYQNKIQTYKALIQKTREVAKIYGIDLT